MSNSPFGFVLATVALTSPAWASDYVVAPGGSIQAAIGACADNDRVLVQAGTYFEAIDTLGKTVEIIGVDGASATTLDATGLGRSVVTLRGKDSLPQLRGFTITGGAGSFHPLNNVFGGGGIIDLDDTRGLVADCVVRGNHVANGGQACGGGFLGRMVAFSTSISHYPTLTDCVFENNTADDGGGGIAGLATVVRSVVEHNLAGRGGGLYSEWLVIAQSCVVRENYAAVGGGVWADNFNLLGSEIADNVATIEGGGLWSSTGGFGGFHQVWSVRIIGNTAPHAGAIVIDNQANWAWVSFSGSIIADNTSTNLASSATVSISATTALLEVVNTTFVGERVKSFTAGGTIANSVLRATTWNHTGGTLKFSSSDVQGGAPGINNFDADPRFANTLARDYHLISTSPCIAYGEKVVNTASDVELQTNPPLASDIGGDRFQPHLEFVGTGALGSVLRMRANGAPQGPVLVFVSTTRLDVPMLTAAGAFGIGLPLAFGGPLAIGSVPPSGTLSVSGTLPINAPSGVPIYAQALWSNLTLSDVAWAIVH